MCLGFVKNNIVLVVFVGVVIECSGVFLVIRLKIVLGVVVFVLVVCSRLLEIMLIVIL